MPEKPTTYGCLYGIGVGPGDPELITLKALKALQKAPVICVPQAANRRDSYALSIVKDYVKPEQEILRAPFPTDDAEVPPRRPSRIVPGRIGHRRVHRR